MVKYRQPSGETRRAFWTTRNVSSIRDENVFLTVSLALMTNADDICITECGKRSYLEVFNHSVLVSLGNDILWLNFEGKIQWAVDISQDLPVHICTGPLGDYPWIATQSDCLSGGRQKRTYQPVRENKTSRDRQGAGTSITP